MLDTVRAQLDTDSYITDADYNQLNTAQWEYDREPKPDTELQFSGTTYYNPTANS